MIRGLVSVDGARTAKPFEPIVRARVVERLVQAATYRITVIVAPAGFGKTVAIGHYLARQAVEHVRFSLRREHASLAGFVRGFVQAIEPIAPLAERSVASICENAQKSESPVAGIAAWLEFLLERYAGTIVLDDVHAIASDRHAQELLADLISRTNSNVRWLLSMRDACDLPLSSWLAYGEMDMPVDETELRLTFDEAAAAAGASNVHVRESELRELLALTDGWPTAFTFALRASTRTSDLKAVAAGTRDMTYRFLAEQVFRALPEDDRRFLMETAVLPVLDVRALEAAGREDAAATVARLRRQTSFINPEPDGTFRYQDLFREFLEFQLKQEGAATYGAAAGAAARMLESQGRTAEALALHVQAGAPSDVERVLAAHGSGLLDRGLIDALEAALGALPAEAREGATMLGLQAAVHAYRGRLEAAESCYEKAREACVDATVSAEFAHRHATMLLGGARFADALEVLETVPERALRGDRLRARFLATKASALSFAGSIETAMRMAGAALAAAGRTDDELVRAVAYQHAAAVSIAAGRFEEARAHAQTSIAIAERHGFFGIAARSATQAYVVAYELGDQAQCSWSLAQIRRNAERAGDQGALLYAATVGYDLAAQRGDLERLDELEAVLNRHADAHKPLTSEALLPACALQAAWLGDFDRARALLHGTAAAQRSPARRALRAAETMLYAAAAGLRGEAESAGAAVVEALATLPSYEERSVRTVKARVLYALGSLVMQRTATCHNVLRSLEERVGEMPFAIAKLVRAARTTYLHVETGSAFGDAGAALADLRAANMAGYARLIEALPLPEKSRAPLFAALTKAELRVLSLLAGGSTSREAAGELQRSVLTVDSHVKAIVRKLQCRGRREAIALARSHGLV